METFGIVLTAELIVIVIGFPLYVIAARCTTWSTGCCGRYSTSCRRCRPLCISFLRSCFSASAWCRASWRQSFSVATAHSPDEPRHSPSAEGARRSGRGFWQQQRANALESAAARRIADRHDRAQSVHHVGSVHGRPIGAMIGAGGLGSEVLRGISGCKLVSALRAAWPSSYWPSFWTG